MKLYTFFDVDLTEWALPLEVWWTREQLCFEVLCFAVTFGKPSLQIVVDEVQE